MRDGRNITFQLRRRRRRAEFVEDFLYMDYEFPDLHEVAEISVGCRFHDRS